MQYNSNFLIVSIVNMQTYANKKGHYGCNVVFSNEHKNLLNKL